MIADGAMLIVDSVEPHVDCVLCSLASVLRVKRDTLAQSMGTDGTEIILPDAEGKQKYKGVLLDEVVRYCVEIGVTCTPMSTAIYIDTPDGQELILDEMELPEFEERYMKGREGILFGKGKFDGYHAVAWDGENILDPNGYKYQLVDNGLFTMEHFVWVVLSDGL